RNDRAAWLEEEIRILTDPATYTLDPRESWRRFKLRGGSRRTLALLREIAAQQRNLPRNRVLRDEQVMEIAAHAPSTPADLARTRGLGKGFVEGKFGAEVLEVIRHALA